MFDVEGSARNASGPLPAENREAGNSVASSLAPCLFGRRQVQVRAFQSFKISNRVRHFSQSNRSAYVGCWVSMVCSFLEGSGGRRHLLGRQHSTPCHELVGTRWQRRSQVNSWGQGITTRAMVRRITRERSAAPTASVKKEVGPPPAKKSKSKSDGKGGKNKRVRCTLDQDGAQLCFSWKIGGGTCGELPSGSPCPAGRIHKCTTCRSDKHSARQCPQT